MNDPVALIVAPVTLLFGFFFDRDGFPGDHGLVDGTATFEDNAIDRNFFSGADAQFIPRLHLFERNVFFQNLASGTLREQARGFWTQVEQCADGGAGTAASAQFHDLAEQDEGRDRGRGFEVNVGVSAHASQGVWKNLRCERSDDAVDIGNSRAQSDQGEHVRAAVDERRPEALKERKAAPEDDRSGENKFEPGQARAVENVHECVRPDHAAHGHREQWGRKRDADPESPRHVAQFWIVFLRRGYSARLERHAADRARSGLGAHDLRMHRAGIFSAGCG